MKMKLDITKDIEDQKTTYVLTIEKQDMITAKFTKRDRQLFEICDKSDKISDKLLALEMIAMKIEEVEQPKSL